MFNIDSAIQQTERHYREQLFSSGCFSLVPIFRISENTTSIESLLKQLNGHPYIAPKMQFSQKVIDTLLESDIYIHDGKHLFLEGEMDRKVVKVVEQWSKVEFFDRIMKSEARDLSPKAVDAAIENLKEKFPVLKNIDLPKLLAQIDEMSQSIQFDSTIDGYLDIFSKTQWLEKYELNRSSLVCMVSIGNRMQLDQSKMRDLITLGLLKDLGYARLAEFIDHYELMHTLVSHKIVGDSNKSVKEGLQINDEVLTAILLHHEFLDGSGPLAKAKHPMVLAALENEGIPLIAQISGICDLYLGFFEQYDPAEAFSITCGYVLGDGVVPPRYDTRVITAFVSDFRSASYHWKGEQPFSSETLVKSILATLADPVLQKKAGAMISAKAKTDHDSITLALNLIRNVSVTNPKHLSDTPLTSILKLPIEFGNA